MLVVGAAWVEPWFWRGPMLVLAVGGLAFTLFFFRDPERTPPLDARENGIVAPADGRVVEIVDEEEPLYLWHPKASDKNERSEFGLRHPNGTKLLFKQIAGAMARRIEYGLEEGDTVETGQRFGIVKFGSRMDLLVPPSVNLNVNEGQAVRAGTTVLGRMPDAESEATSSSRPAGAVSDTSASPPRRSSAS
ncbi:MAG: phosphatidylserine decarboxylase family protein [Bacteroidetes bacterium QH_1_64_81]|nr:MAG: phosphatidylserine decarboxylase family protein [Bacteroidetes bacterium QH_1_64_81]